MNSQKSGTTSKADATTTKGQDRRTGTQGAVSKLVAERTEMLTLFCRVAGLEPYEQGRHKSPPREVFQEFLQVLVDYLAAGHFSLYERIANGSERRRAVSDLAAQLYPRIAESTQAALDFNDRYDGKPFEISPMFHEHLSQLGELLASRIEIEDKIINEILH
jgi:regulator of sigma D